MTVEQQEGTGTAPPWWAPLVAAANEVEGPDVPRVVRDTSRLRSADEARSASVLVLLSDRGEREDDHPSVLLQQRASGLRHHPGEVAFPGGAADPGDADAAATALREAAEELAVDPRTVAIGASLPPLWIPVSGFAVTPVLALWTNPHPVTPVDGEEVAAAHRVGLPSLADPASRGSVRYPSGRTGPGFIVPGVPLIWGFTAGVLSWLLDLGGWSRPWNTGRMMELEGF
ncbi:NUDIX hydrolase [Glycomyces arizonensis]|uniref:NUDIX hydrolase n=1 Tax=Glycomyces arizonensis TaxID=256035 RepID=UPI0004046BA2|nr:NUDIX domain-containing protein [Glycomyces arizonensis]